MAITNRERDELSKLVKARGRVAKAGIDQRKAELLANVEAQLAAIYKPADDPDWKEAFEAFQVAVAEADAKVAAGCERLGFGRSFRPGLSRIGMVGAKVQQPPGGLSIGGLPSGDWTLMRKGRR